jgi:hypothetical protein
MTSPEELEAMFAKREAEMEAEDKEHARLREVWDNWMRLFWVGYVATVVTCLLYAIVRGVTGHPQPVLGAICLAPILFVIVTMVMQHVSFRRLMKSYDKSFENSDRYLSKLINPEGK